MRIGWIYPVNYLTTQPSLVTYLLNSLNKVCIQSRNFPRLTAVQERRKRTIRSFSSFKNLRGFHQELNSIQIQFHYLWLRHIHLIARALIWLVYYLTRPQSPLVLCWKVSFIFDSMERAYKRRGVYEISTVATNYH